MTSIATLKYKYEDLKSDIRLMSIIGLGVIGIVISIYMKSLLVVGGFIGVIWVLLVTGKDGVVEIFQKDNVLFLTKKENGHITEKEKIVSHKFRWTQNYLPIGKGGQAGSNATTHISFVFLRVEFVLECGQTVILGKELYQWRSIPKSWEYELIDDGNEKLIGLTSYNLQKLKKQIEEIK